MSAIEKLNDQGVSVNRKLSSSLNRFFKQFPYLLEGCSLRKDWDGADYALIIEGSSLHDELNYGYSDGAIYAYHELGVPIKAWEVHTAFHQAFNRCDYHPEMMNSCVIGFYK